MSIVRDCGTPTSQTILKNRPPFKRRWLGCPKISKRFIVSEFRPCLPHNQTRKVQLKRLLFNNRHHNCESERKIVVAIHRCRPTSHHHRCQGAGRVHAVHCFAREIIGHAGQAPGRRCARAVEEHGACRSRPERVLTPANDTAFGLRETALSRAFLPRICGVRSSRASSSLVRPISDNWGLPARHSSLMRSVGIRQHWTSLNYLKRRRLAWRKLHRPRRLYWLRDSCS